MTLIEFGEFAKARVWIGQLPMEAGYKGAQSIERILHVNASAFCVERSAAVELLVPKGGFAYYGLLGAAWRPSAGKNLLIRVPTSNYDGLPLPENLGTRADDVRVGLPDEYALGALDGICDESTPLGAGELIVTHAAHGLVGSNLTAFRWLGRILAKILISLNSDEIELRRILEAVYTY